jgi:hypothetical protein
VPLDGIAMNVIPMMNEIHLVANPMIRKSSLPDFLIAPDDTSESMRVRAIDQLDGAFNRHIGSGRQEQMNMFRHDNQSVQAVATFATIPIQRFQEETYINFDREQFAAVESREGHEISSRRGDESSRLQGETSAAGSRTSLQTLNWHEWNSCPSRLNFLASVLALGKN